MTVITTITAAAALALPAAAQAASCTVVQVNRTTVRAVTGSDAMVSLRATRAQRSAVQPGQRVRCSGGRVLGDLRFAGHVHRLVLTATVRSVNRRVLTVALAGGGRFAIRASNLSRGPRGVRLLARLRPRDRLLVVIRFRHGRPMRVRLVPLRAPAEPAYDPGEYDPGDYDGGDYDGGDYDGGDYDPGDHPDEDGGNAPPSEE